MITLLDYGAGNVRSVINALKSIGENVKVVADVDDILSAEKLIFPGVGNFGSMMRILYQKQYVDPLKDYLRSGRPFFGICLGLPRIQMAWVFFQDR
jgi:glutamine amidotransferase/cyclase